MSDQCGICGLNLNEDFCHTLNCNHTFHYQCLFDTFKHDIGNTCPYCRSISHKLPLVNGTKKISYTIHDLSTKNTFVNKPCDHILKTGKNKGQICNKNCKLGYFKCGRHIKKI